MGRAPCCDKDNVKKGPWSPEEDSKLKAYIEEHGTGNNWIALPHKVGLRRCGKSCRLRWLNYLRPNIKHGGFSEDEDRIICGLYVSIGSRWSIIAAQLPGRTDNDIKNYWNTRLKKRILGRRQLCANDRLPKEGGSNPNPIGPSHTLTASALERLQLHMQLQNLHNPFSFYRNTASYFNGKPLQTLSTASPLNHLHQPSLCNSMNAICQENIGIPSSSCSNNLVTELHDLVFTSKENQLTHANVLNETNEGEGIGWWGNNVFEEKPTSSWDFASALQPDAVLMHDYGHGYEL